LQSRKNPNFQLREKRGLVLFLAVNWLRKKLGNGESDFVVQ